MSILIVLLFLMLSFFFTSSEMAFIAANNLIVLIRSRQSYSYRNLYKLLVKPEIYLYTVLVGNNLAIVILTTLSERMFAAKGAVGDSFLFSMVLSLIILIIAEIFPKTMTNKNPEGFALIYAPVIRVFYTVLYPVIFVSTFISEMIFRIAGLKGDGMKTPRLSKSDLMFFVRGEMEKNSRTDRENRLVMGIFEFNDKRASDIMIPRTDILSIGYEDTFDKAKKMLLEENHIFTRLPVYTKNEDTITGIVNVNDLILNRERQAGKLMEEAHFFPETISLDKLLVGMKESGIHMAIILDEYGGLAGLVTLEDIVEELIGNISDEYDTDPSVIRKKGQIIIDGDTKTEELAEEYEIHIPESSAYETIAGYIMYRLGRMPVEGDIVKLSRMYNITVTKMNENAVERISIERIADENDK